jgi:hypothetical protein
MNKAHKRLNRILRENRKLAHHAKAPKNGVKKIAIARMREEIFGRDAILRMAGY